MEDYFNLIDIEVLLHEEEEEWMISPLHLQKQCDDAFFLF